jgi:hypothetical protein
MSRESERMAEVIEALDGSATLQVEAVMGLFRPDNVEELVDEMPEGFRTRFLEWCFALHRGGPPLGEWEPAFARGFDAVRDWIDGQLSPAALSAEASAGDLPIDDASVATLAKYEAVDVAKLGTTRWPRKPVDSHPNP